MNIKLILVILLAALCIGGGAYYFNQHSDSASNPNTQITQPAEDAYVVSVEDSKITYVHVDALGPRGAIAAARKDGTCTPSMSDDDCGTAIDVTPVYDVATKAIKTMPLSADVTLTDMRQQPMSLADLKNDTAKLDTTSGNYYGDLYHLTFNNIGEVVKIDGVFRP